MRILLAIDDSKFSEAAINAFIAQTRPQDTEVRVLHVIEPVPIYVDGQAWGNVPEPAVVQQEQRKEAEDLVSRAARKLLDAGFNVTTALEEGSPKVVVTDSASEWHADLIVLGSHGRRGMDRFLMGSVSEAVVRHAPCSVQVVRIPKS